jgi:hypothetical protein
MKVARRHGSWWLRRSSLAAVLCATFCLVSVANASALLFKAEAAPVTYKGAQLAGSPVTFSTKAGTAQCTALALSGTNNSASSSTAEIAPAFGAGTCKNFGMANKSINANGCKLKFTLGAATATLDIVGCTGKGIEIEATGCPVTVSPQMGVKDVVFTNTGGSGASRDLTGRFRITNTLAYVVPAGCTLTTPGSFTDGSLSGEFTLEGEKQGIWVE